MDQVFGEAADGNPPVAVEGSPIKGAGLDKAGTHRPNHARSLKTPQSQSENTDVRYGSSVMTFAAQEVYDSASDPSLIPEPLTWRSKTSPAPFSTSPESHKWSAVQATCSELSGNFGESSSFSDGPQSLQATLLDLATQLVRSGETPEDIAEQLNLDLVGFLSHLERQQNSVDGAMSSLLAEINTIYPPDSISNPAQAFPQNGTQEKQIDKNLSEAGLEFLEGDETLVAEDQPSELKVVQDWDTTGDTVIGHKPTHGLRTDELDIFYTPVDLPRGRLGSSCKEQGIDHRNVKSHQQLITPTVAHAGSSSGLWRAFTNDILRSIPLGYLCLLAFLFGRVFGVLLSEAYPIPRQYRFVLYEALSQALAAPWYWALPMSIEIAFMRVVGLGMSMSIYATSCLFTCLVLSLVWSFGAMQLNQ
jgi:hypothetical protein